MLMKNFTCEIKTVSDLAIVFYTDEDGKDWYESQKLFAASTLKIMFDNAGNIVASAWDVSMLAPDGLSVAEIKKSAVPGDFFDNGKRWLFDGKNIKPFEYSPAEIVQQAESKKSELLEAAKSKIIVAQTKLTLGRTLSDTELTTLNGWLDYIDALETVDLTGAPDIDWPEVSAYVA